eukprot:gene1884-1149_t
MIRLKHLYIHPIAFYAIGLNYYLSRSNFSFLFFRFLTLANHTIFFHYLFHIIYLHLTGLHLYSFTLFALGNYNGYTPFFFFLSFCPDPLLLAFLTFLRWEQLTYLYGVLFYFLIFLLFLHHSKGGGFNQPLKYRPSSREKVLNTILFICIILFFIIIPKRVGPLAVLWFIHAFNAEMIYFLTLPLSRTYCVVFEASASSQVERTLTSNKHKKTIKTHVILSIVTLSEHITNDQIKTSVYPSNSLLRDWTELLVLLLSRSNFSVFWEVLKLSLFRFLTLANHTIFFHYLFHIIYLHLTGLHLYICSWKLKRLYSFLFFLSFCPDPLLLAFLTFLRWEQLTYLYGVLFYFLIFLLFLHHSKGGGFNQPLKYRPSSREKVLSREE